MKNTIAAALAIVGASFLPTASSAAEASAIFAGGCFWCMESDFEKVPGVSEVVSGYTGGATENPTYRNHADHVEAVRIVYDDAVVTYDRLLEIFWRSVDPTDAGSQFCDRGHSYTTAIFALDAAQKQAALATKEAIEKSGKLGAPVATPILDATKFTDAEDYHQDYYKKNPVRYAFYRRGCGRDARIEQLWGEDAFAGNKHDS